MIKINDFEIYKSCYLCDGLGNMWFVDYRGVPLDNFFSRKKALFRVIYLLNNSF